MHDKNIAISLISPATPCNEEMLAKIDNFLLNNNLLRVSNNINNLVSDNCDNEFATTDSKIRFDELYNEILSQKSAIIWCSRGGYGSAEILQYLYKTENKMPQNKIFIGFSDITSISIFLIQKWRWKVIYGPMLYQMANKMLHQDSVSGMINLIKDIVNNKNHTLSYKIMPMNYDAKNVDNLSAEIIGGCISVISSHYQTLNKIDWHNKILFLEDEGESGERLDRYFWQIITIIKEQNMIPRAIILGNLQQENNHGKIAINNIEWAIKNFADKILANSLNIPLFCDEEGVLGHSFNMKPVILGVNSLIHKESMQYFLRQDY